MNSRIVLYLSFLLIAVRSYSLDTNEPLARGLTDFEAYYTWSHPSSHSLQGVLGYGASDIVNVYLSPSIASGQKLQFNVLNIATVFQGSFDLDVFLAVQSDFDSLQFPVGLEVTYPLKEITLYSQPLVTLGTRSVGTSSFLPLGFFVTVIKDTQLFFQLDYSTGSWAGFGGAAGVNLSVGALELIAEFGARPGFYGTLGFIFTLDQT